MKANDIACGHVGWVHGIDHDLTMDVEWAQGCKRPQPLFLSYSNIDKTQIVLDIYAQRASEVVLCILAFQLMDYWLLLR